MEKNQYLEIGQIVNTHGIRGEVRIQPWADSPEFLLRFKTFYIDGAPVRVRAARVHKGCVIALFDGVEDVNAAMGLKNKTLCIDRADARLPKGSFFLADILGARVVTEDGAEIGTLADTLDLPGQRVYVVRGEREHLIPAVPEFILHTDADAGVITVHLIEGM